ncbi:MAG: ATP-dependent Clp protease ATP-binding subunit [Clostridiales bacterium]|nr:ATP-dependent Clp protease ATP-binding subunit [Clostridiales bacterium]
MHPTICTRCKKNVAVVFITKIENGETRNEGLCLKCARELGIKPVDDMMKKMGISDEDLESISTEMLSAFGGAEEADGLAPSSDDGENGDGEEDEGRTATFPFLNKLFGGQGSDTPQPDRDPMQRGGAAREDKAAANKADRGQKRKFLENYCISLTRKAHEGRLDRIVGRANEIERTIQILNRRQKNNPCLIGAPGVGKTAIAEGLAQRIYDRDVPYKLLDKEVYLLDLTALVAGTQFRGQFESRMKGLIDEVKKLGNIILVIDEVHSIVGAGDAEGSMNAANILKPALSRGEIQVIGATTLTEYRKYIEKDSALERRFQPVIVEEPSIDDSVEILKGIAPYYESFHHVTISPDICRQAVVMSERYITDRYLPDKAIDLIDEASSDVNLHNKELARLAEIDKELADYAKEMEVVLASTGGQNDPRLQELQRQEQRLQRQRDTLEMAVSRDDAEAPNRDDPAFQERQDGRRRQIAELQQRLTSVTAEKQAVQAAANDRAYQRLAELKSRQAQLTGERSAIAAKGDPPLTAAHLAKVIELWTKIPASSIQEQEFERLAKLDERLKAHIVGQDDAVNAVSNAIRRGRVGISAKHKPVSFIFVGSTGVGKTELVKRLAADLFSSPESLIRLDMSEFMEKHSVSRIIGSPPGYVGYDDAGQLTEKIRRKPYTVVLFDEIEKAHPDVLNVLLQILDDGHISDAHGKVVNFENTVIVMTSNAGSDIKGGSLGFDRSANQLGKEKAMKGLESFLRPEFINRVDEIVYFDQLTEDNFKAIARIMLGELDAVMKDKNIAFSYDESVLDYLVKKSYSAAYGARNLRRQIQKDLEDPIAAKLIQRYADPITAVSLSADGETLNITTD